MSGDPQLEKRCRAYMGHHIYFDRHFTWLRDGSYACSTIMSNKKVSRAPQT